MGIRYIAAVDLGASSGCVMACNLSYVNTANYFAGDPSFDQKSMKNVTVQFEMN